MATELLEAPSMRAEREAQGARFVADTLATLHDADPQYDAHTNQVTGAPLIGGKAEMIRGITSDRVLYRKAPVHPTE